MSSSLCEIMTFTHGCRWSSCSAMLLTVVSVTLSSVLLSRIWTQNFLLKNQQQLRCHRRTAKHRIIWKLCQLILRYTTVNNDSLWNYHSHDGQLIVWHSVLSATCNDGLSGLFRGYYHLFSMRGVWGSAILAKFKNGQLDRHKTDTIYCTFQW